MLSRAMNAKLVRVYADEVIWLTARLNRRAEDLESKPPESQEFREAVLVADFLAREITVAVQKLRARATSSGRRPH
jgi:hypothetical protein